MSTFSELKTRIAKKLLDPNNVAVSAEDVGLAINDAIDFWKEKKFWFNETSQSVTLTVDDPEITMPSDFLFEIDTGGFIISYANTEWELKKVHVSEYEANDTAGKGLPYIYTYKGGSWLVYYYPDQAYSLVITYIKDYADLVNDADTNDFTLQAKRLIEYEALSRLYAEFRQDEKMEAYYSNRAKSERNNLRDRTSKVSGTGTLTIDHL